MASSFPSLELTKNSPPFHSIEPQIVVETARKAFKSRKTLPLAFRRRQLKQFQRMLDEGREVILNALYRDLRKPPLESDVYELQIVQDEVRSQLKHLRSWTKEQYLPRNLLYPGDRMSILPEPLGLVLILSPWNYPFLLSLTPLAGAIAAGNCVILKPSEVSERSAGALSNLIGTYLDQECYRVLQGGVAETQELLTLKFDHIFFTGSSSIGRIVMSAAAQHLTPVTLELGGKNPLYVDDHVDLFRAARQIVRGKLMNLGQTCLSPDYVLVSRRREGELINALRKILMQFYGLDPHSSPDLSRIINERHFLRIRNLLDGTKGQIVIGGRSNLENLWIEPTVVTNVHHWDDVLMKEELFGPVLPILNVNSPEEACEFIRQGEKPLVIYVFGSNSTARTFKRLSSSGALVMNDIAHHLFYPGLPFGGIGKSGMGNYRGRFTMNTFSHEKAVFHKGNSCLSEFNIRFLQPPYNAGLSTFAPIFKFLMGHLCWFNVGCNRGCLSLFTHALVFGLGFGAMWLLFNFVDVPLPFKNN